MMSNDIPYHERTIRVLKRRVSRQNGVVRFNDRVGGCRSGVNTEFELGFFAIIGRKTIQKKGTETRTSSTTERMENEETLETRAIVRQATDLVHNGLDLLFSDGVVTTSICGSNCLENSKSTRTLITYSCLPHPLCHSQEFRDERDSCKDHS